MLAEIAVGAAAIEADVVKGATDRRQDDKLVGQGGAFLAVLAIIGVEDLVRVGGFLAQVRIIVANRLDAANAKAVA
ncbi:hypothetical protein GCM10011614_33330 [Novosphingobium colocasiae]|uniref:Uncharacterized protein n=1 Tax=Novosphingobium colocasiae TaxID=1256513 RepID=A0A918PMD3_9SPHN|nr:hypothetical protein GCM10011614_33330 [Novosphingobium colocasiae]